MKKNWVIFIAISVAVWLFVVLDSSKRARAYDAQKKEYEAVLVAQQQIADEEAAKRDAERATLKEQVAAVTNDAATTGTMTNASSSVRAMEKKLFNPRTAKTHIIDTPLYRVVLSEMGAVPISWEIRTSRYVTNLARSTDTQTSTTVELIPQSGDPELRNFPLSLTGATARDFNRELFNITQEKVSGGVRVIASTQPGPDSDMIVRKEFFFRDDSYVANVKIVFQNGEATRKKLGGQQGFGTGWQGGFGEPEAEDRAHGGTSLIYATQDQVRLWSPSLTTEQKNEFNGSVDWAGEEKKFFVVLIAPDATNPTQSIRSSYESINESPEYAEHMGKPQSVELLHPSKELGTGEATTLAYQVYVGPKNREALSSKDFALPPKAKNPNSVVFHTMPLKMSFLRPLALALLTLMRWLHGILGAWGLAIIGTTLIVRIVIYPLTHWAIKNQARTMIEQQRIKPEMDRIGKQFKNDPMKKNQAVMQLYREHGINPLGFARGCFPMLLQTPIFLALYMVFEQSVELRGQPFLWIADLSQPDRLFVWTAHLPLIGNSFNLLPLIMAGTNFLQMRIMQMPSQDETQAAVQKQMMFMMPVIFTFFLYQLPSGLIVYWIVSNTVSIGQSVLTKRIIAKHKAAHGIT
ncbi:membrane protein insertase YidC [soil metagenome]